MYHKKTLAYISVGFIFTLTLGNISISAAADSIFTSKSLNMKGHMLAYADMVDPKTYGGAKTGGGRYGMSLMDKNKDGKVSKEEFLKYNEAIFNKVDANRDGSVDKNEADNYVAKSKPKISPSNPISHGEMKK